MSPCRRHLPLTTFFTILLLTLFNASQGKTNNVSSSSTRYAVTVNHSSSNRIWNSNSEDVEVESTQLINATNTLFDMTEEFAALEEILMQSSYAKHLERSSVIFGLTLIANESVVSDVCQKHLKRVQRGILQKQPWAMKGKYKTKSSISIFCCYCLYTKQFIFSFGCLWHKAFWFCVWSKLLAGQS